MSRSWTMSPKSVPCASSCSLLCAARAKREKPSPSGIRIPQLSRRFAKFFRRLNRRACTWSSCQNWCTDTNARRQEPTAGLSVVFFFFLLFFFVFLAADFGEALVQRSLGE